MNCRTAALRAVHQVNVDHNRAATYRDISLRARMRLAAAYDAYLGLIGDELVEPEKRGVWLTEKGVAALDRDRPLRVPEELLVTNSEWKD